MHHEKWFHDLLPTLRGAFIYAFFGALWILLSDRALSLWTQDATQLTTWQTYKGWLFVVASTLLIAGLLQHTQRSQRHTLEALAASEQRYRALVDGIEDYAIILLDAEGVITTWNPGAELMTGYSAAEAIGRSHAIFFTPEDRATQTPEQLLMQARRAGRAEQEGWRLHKDGACYWGNTILTCLRRPDGAIYGFARIARNLTERKTAEEHIRRLNRLYAVLSEINQTIVRTRQPEMFLTRACQIAVELGGLRMAWIGMVDPTTNSVRAVAHAGVIDGYLDRLHIVLDDPASGRGPTATALWRGVPDVINIIEDDPRLAPRRADALRMGYRALAAFPLISNGKVRGVLNLYAAEPNFFDAEEIKLLSELALDLAFALEVAEQEAQRVRIEAEKRLAEERLQQHAAALEVRVQQRTRELEAAMHRAQTADRLKSTFLATMSHELRTPLNSIIGFSEILSSQSFGPLGHGNYAEYARDIHVSGRHLLGVVNDLLLMSKLDAGQHQIEIEAVALDEIVRESERMVSADAQARGIEIAVAPPAEPLDVLGGHQALRQILINLLGNAIKFSPEGGRIDVAWRRAGPGRCALTVADRGCGMPADVLARLGRPFNQSDSSFTRHHQGSGLGLAICFGLARAMNGAIAVSSAPGAGTAITLEMPLAPPSKTAQARGAALKLDRRPAAA